ncbi:MAG: DUF2161 family putative PD-(D/E)XK-type phosphodiesterase [Pseudomonadota bacterium]
MDRISETELYAPVKAFLEGQGYTVKAEVGPADIVACRNGEEPVVVELKTGFSLALFHQGVARLGVSDLVYLAVPRGSGRAWMRALTDNVKLARRLGLGVISVRLKDGFVQVHADPGPYAPRKSARRTAVLLKEFAKRRGDPNTGGQTRAGLVTAYRQDATLIARHLHAHGPSKGADVARATGVAAATRMMSDNHYGWFERVSTGIYALTDTGRSWLVEHGADAIR